MNQQAYVLPSPQMAASAIIADVIELARKGRVPRDVDTFARLHDYCDANVLGTMETDFDGLTNASNDMDVHGAEFAQHEREYDAQLGLLADLANAASDIVEKWLKSGGLRDAVSEARTA